MIGGIPAWLFEAVVAPIIVAAVCGFAALWLKMQNTVAVLQDRSEHDEHDSAPDSETVAELKRQARRSEDRIGELERRNSELERALDREREERADENRRHAREIADLNRQLQEVLRDLANTRQRYSGNNPTT